MHIIPERAGDADAIRAVTQAAFASLAHSQQTEAAIVDALRASGALTVSLVAVEGDEVLGHAAISPVAIDSGAQGWFGLGPVSVLPDRQGEGVGARLIRAALGRLEALGAAGCVVLGDPGYYARFGFAVQPGLVYAGAPPEYFQALAFKGSYPAGQVAYHQSFEAS
ncbi:MAG: N-acetyltransferase [Oceanicaulis sp.]|nr:N-acetyltransferase [Oceanicaulis sp.]